MNDTARAAPLQIRIIAMIVLTVLFNSAGNLFLSTGMKQIGDIGSWMPDRLASLYWHALTNGTIWIGIVVLVLFFACYLVLLSWADYSYVHPASAAGYVIVPLLGYAFAGEQVSTLRWSGIVLITLGVTLVGQTPPRTTSAG
jgi:uncharacterized membrane protein